MYPNLGRHYLWPNPMHVNWYNSYGGYYWNPSNFAWNQANWNETWNPYSASIPLRDYGPTPFVVNIEQAAKQNNNYRTALWTGKHMQVTLMSIPVGDDIGLEVHPTTDQFIRIEEGQGLVQMGDSKNHLDFQQMAYDDYAIMIPAGKWHNVTNTGNKPLKVYVIYAPPHHPFGTVHQTKEMAQAAEG
ncbi:cupin domain-containing protein [Brevibacillus sp. AY1]|uniref:cupin domain-containing protein n=1 Tax=Brevibacillus sp. AY1 TaxID=2807621 RepID=UPI0024576053|nr:cupin domain-containing protein [Brevibacillus sp. AY1]MDH4616207.1 cupin domain-containing protein [Brevibacillus sp. AY1]